MEESLQSPVMGVQLEKALRTAGKGWGAPVTRTLPEQGTLPPDRASQISQVHEEVEKAKPTAGRRGCPVQACPALAHCATDPRTG